MAAKPLRVLVGCERSGVVREAFRALGHEAWSCDLAPADDGSPFHIQMDVRGAILHGVPRWLGTGYDFPHLSPWDLAIFHPPCTYLCNSGVRWFTTIPKIQKPGVSYGEDRWRAMHAAVTLFADLWHCGIPRIAIENPVPHKHARIALANQDVPTFTQSIQPWQFGEKQFKRTCLWLHGLDPLEPTEDLSRAGGLPKAGTAEHKAWSTVHRESPGPERARKRSETYHGIAAAMAWQWGGDARGGASE